MNTSTAQLVLFIMLRLYVCEKIRTLIKIIIALLRSCIMLIGYGKEHKAYRKLCEVNRCRTEQNNLSFKFYPNRLSACTARNEATQRISVIK